MSVWIKLDADYPTHPKTLRLCRLLGDVADAYPIRLWTWCARYARDGKPDTALVEEACRWKGDTGALIAALKTVGFLDEDGSVHDWEDWTGEFLDQLECRRKRQRQAKKSRRRQREEVGEKSARRPRDIGEKSARSRRPEGEEKESREDKKEKTSGTPAEPAPPSATRSWHGVKSTTTPVLRMLDRRLRERDEALALPDKLGERAATAINAAMVGQDPARVRYAVFWAFDDAWYADKIRDPLSLIGNLKGIISGSAETWKGLKGELAFLDEVPA